MSTPLSQRSHRNRKSSRKFARSSDWGKVTKSWKRWWRGVFLDRDVRDEREG